MHLFVYGTLLSDVPSSMAKFLRRRATLVGKATATGRLDDMGMYPGFTTGGGTIKGELYELDGKRVEETLRMLDAYEGVTGEREDEYRRGKVVCRTASGEEFQAQTYLSVDVPAGAAQIKSGDYAKFYAGSAAHQRFVNGG